MYITFRHVIVIAAIYGAYRVVKAIYQEDKKRLADIEEAVRELRKEVNGKS